MALLSHHLLSGEPALAKIPSKNWAEAAHPTFASNSQHPTPNEQSTSAMDDR